MKGSEIYKFIKPHLGRINSTGDHGIDIERLENFKTYEELEIIGNIYEHRHLLEVE